MGNIDDFERLQACDEGVLCFQEPSLSTVQLDINNEYSVMVNRDTHFLEFHQ